MSNVPVLRRLMQADHKIQANLGSMENPSHRQIKEKNPKP
jgi:hypothetical protein